MSISRGAVRRGYRRRCGIAWPPLFLWAKADPRSQPDINPMPFDGKRLI
jgi:hypothetical protein